jgi:hypothetical protein
MKSALLNSDDLTRFEHQYSQQGLGSTKSAPAIDGHATGDYAVVEDGKKLSIDASLPGAPNLIAYVPRLFAWADADSFLDLIHRLDYQVAQIRLRHALDDIEKVGPEVSGVLRNLLQKLSPWAAARFAMAPSTRNRVAFLHQDPASHIAFLYRSIKAELRLSGETVSGEGCWTSLGDFFLTGHHGDFIDPCSSNWTPEMNLRTPRLHHVVPVDMLSPNVCDLSPAKLPYSLHDFMELAVVKETLENAVRITKSTAPTAGQIIERFAKVIVVFKTKTGGAGSSSHYAFPGQIVVRNSHATSESAAINFLVHESIHQVLYVMEGGQRFVDPRASANQTAVSAWTERQLPIHSYLHACFVWYGLATFWRRALHSALLPANSMQAQLDEALRGFRAGNPADRLLPYREMICPEAMQSVASLWDELRKAGELEGQPMAVRNSRPAGAKTLTPAASAVN